MGSKKHFSPRYHKLRDLARIAASPTSSSSKQFRYMKSFKHSASRARSRTNLTVVAKTRCLCDDESVLTCPRCDQVAAPLMINRRVGHGHHDNLKYVRWQSDKLNPGRRWARSVSARHGYYVLESRLRAMPGVAGSHLKFHIRLREPKTAQPVCSAGNLKRYFERLGLRYLPDAEHLLREVARFAYMHKAEDRLATWTQVYAGTTRFADGFLWMPFDWQWWSNHSPHESASIHLPLRKVTPVGFKINGKWKLTPEEFMREYVSDAHRPLYSADDITDWASDMLQFFNTFYARNYFSTAYGRWVLRYTLSYLQLKGN